MSVIHLSAIHVLFKFTPNPYSGVEIDVTSNKGRFASLSPFILDASKYGSKTFENLWQYSKVYPEHVTMINGLQHINQDWYSWRQNGFASPVAVRYPVGKGKRPLFSYWNFEKLGYIEARKKLYARIYAELVAETDAYRVLEDMYSDGTDLILKDYDGYDYNNPRMKMTLRDVINNPYKKMGHAFVLAMMLEGKLEECLK